MYQHKKELKAILTSKRANLYYLEKCRVMVKSGRVLYLTQGEQSSQYYNIPIANTTTLLLGMGTSITQAAVRMLAAAGVMIGFCGSGGTPLIAGSEIEWLSPQSEYRPTEYMQGWMKFWFEDEKRLRVAKRFQHARIKFLEKTWGKDRELQMRGFYPDDPELEKPLQRLNKAVENAIDVQALLLSEAQFTKSLYKYAVSRTDYTGFVRAYNGDDDANAFLNHGNYLAYGLAASTLWTLGIPHGFAVMHGKTRRGALVFDVADMIKDALILPWAFICAVEGASEQEFRQQCLLNFTQHKAMEYLFNQVKAAALEGDHL